MGDREGGTNLKEILDGVSFDRNHVLTCVLFDDSLLFLGSRQECFYQLMSLGLPVYTMPVNERNQILADAHTLWIEEQRRTEMMAREQRRLEQQQQQRQLQDETSFHELVSGGRSSYGQEIMQPNTIIDLLRATSSHYSRGDYTGAVG